MPCTSRNLSRIVRLDRFKERSKRLIGDYEEPRLRKLSENASKKSWTEPARFGVAPWIQGFGTDFSARAVQDNPAINYRARVRNNVSGFRVQSLSGDTCRSNADDRWKSGCVRGAVAAAQW